MRKTDDIALWRNFFQTVEQGSLTRAAVRSGVEVSSVSRQIGLLERHVGQPLLVRSSRGVSPTSAGALAYARMRPLVAQVDQATGELDGRKPGLAGLLRIGMPTTGGIDLFLPWILAFQEAHPDVRLDLEFTHRGADALSRGFDLEVHAGALPDDRSVPCRLGGVRRVMIASPAYVARHGLPRHPQDLERHRMVLYARDSHSKPLGLARGAERFALRTEAAITANSEEAMGRAVRAGAGIEVSAPLHKCADELARGALVRVLPDWTVPDLDIHLLRAPGTPSPTVAALIAWIRERWNAAPHLVRDEPMGP